jgi:hypothetical protein
LARSMLNRDLPTPWLPPWISCVRRKAWGLPTMAQMELRAILQRGIASPRESGVGKKFVGENHRPCDLGLSIGGIYVSFLPKVLHTSQGADMF